MTMALTRARERHCGYAVLNTLSPSSSDERYAKTRLFYTSQGFKPLVAFNEDDPANPMMWMLKTLGA